MMVLLHFILTIATGGTWLALLIVWYLIKWLVNNN